MYGPSVVSFVSRESRWDVSSCVCVNEAHRICAETTCHTVGGCCFNPCSVHFLNYKIDKSSAAEYCGRKLSHFFNMHLSFLFKTVFWDDLNAVLIYVKTNMNERYGGVHTHMWGRKDPYIRMPSQLLLCYPYFNSKVL